MLKTSLTLWNTLFLVSAFIHGLICSLLLDSLSGMSFHDLYIRCRESFLVNSDQTLRAQLVEFRDHKLIRAKKVCVCDFTCGGEGLHYVCVWVFYVGV